MEELKKKEADGIFVFGGGCIEDRFIPKLKEMGITEIFGSKTPLKEIVDHVFDMAKNR